MSAIAGLPGFSLRYRVKRREIWNWYWSAWRRLDGLWRYWLALAMAVIGITVWIRSLDHAISSGDFTFGVLIVVFMLMFFVVFPQLAYKPQERLLRVNANGIETSIGSVTGHRGWKDIASITDSGRYIALLVAGGVFLGFFWMRTRNGNAFVIPNRAFGTTAERDEFLHAVTAWHNANAVKYPRLARQRYYG